MSTVKNTSDAEQKCASHTLAPSDSFKKHKRLFSQQAPSTRCQCLDLVEAAHRSRVYPLMYCHIELEGRLNIEQLKHAVDRSARIVPEILCSYHFRRGAFFPSGFTSDDVIVQNDADPSAFMHPDLSRRPQLQIILTPNQQNERVIMIMSHILADGEGFMQYLYLLASLYNGKLPGRKLRNERGLSPLLKNIRVLPPTQQTKHSRHLSTLPLRPSGKGAEFFCLTARIPADFMVLLCQKSKQSGATLNDVFMTAYARVIARLQNTDTVVLPCPADLRRFFPRSRELTIANMTGTYQRLTIEIPFGSPFCRTLQQVHIEMALQKSRRRCFSGIKVLNGISRKVPLPLLEQIIKMSYRLPPVSYTNLGVIRHEKLRFKETRIQDCFFTGTYRLPPDFQLTISTFRGACTLSCTFATSPEGRKNGQYILDQVKQELLGWTREPY